MKKLNIVDWLNENEEYFTKMAQDIWDHPQIAYEETYAADLQMNALKEAGFRIKENVGDSKTAFIAEYGSGKPVIGVLGEYDALPGLSQKVSPIKDEIVVNGPGHGCGHNLLGTAGVEAVMALKEMMEAEEIVGTIRYYGCPAEEVLSGKTFMARTGVFDDLDCALTWHPGTYNTVANMSMQAMVSIKFHFTGIPAHAAGAPHAGRSALDAVEIMNVGANYLREHILDGARIHYVITNGGLAPNIVPESATVWYYIRAATTEQVDELLERVHKCANGAALMTETDVTSELLAYAYETLPNEGLNNVMLKNMMDTAISYTEAEKVFANDLVASIDPKVVELSKKRISAFTDEHLLPTASIHNPLMKGVSVGGSTDVGDVSWITPVGQIMTTCAPVGVQAHSWQATAAYGHSIGYKGMHLAAKTLALSLYDLFADNNLIEEARQEFVQATISKKYVAGIPSDVMPPNQEKQLLVNKG